MKAFRYFFPFFLTFLTFVVQKRDGQAVRNDGQIGRNGAAKRELAQELVVVVAERPENRFAKLDFLLFRERDAANLRDSFDDAERLFGETVDEILPSEFLVFQTSANERVIEF